MITQFILLSRNLTLQTKLGFALKIFLILVFTYKNCTVVPIFIFCCVEWSHTTMNHLQRPLLVVESIQKCSWVLNCMSHSKNVILSLYLFKNQICRSLKNEKAAEKTWASLLINISTKDRDLNVTFRKVVFAEKFNFINHGLESFLVRRAVSELPAGEVVKVTQRSHSRLCVSHDHNVASLGRVRSNYCHLNVWKFTIVFTFWWNKRNLLLDFLWYHLLPASFESEIILHLFSEVCEVCL